MHRLYEERQSFESGIDGLTVERVSNVIEFEFQVRVRVSSKLFKSLSVDYSTWKNSRVPVT